MAKRIKIPQKTELLVMSKSKGYCFCGERGDQIHHIDGVPSNYDFDNLALLCLNHHDEAEIAIGLKNSTKKGLKKRLTSKIIKQRRDELYLLNDKKNDIALEHYGKTLKTITEENLFRASFDALVVYDFVKLEDEFFSLDWDKRESIILKFYLHADNPSIRISNKIISFCQNLSNYTRGGMTYNISCNIEHLISLYFPYSINKLEKETYLELAKKAINTAYNVTYDAFIHLENLAVGAAGLSIFKTLMLRNKELEIDEINKLILGNYKDLERQLERHGRSDLNDAKELVKLFTEDLNTYNSGYPNNMSEDMYDKIVKHRAASYQKIKSEHFWDFDKK